MAQEISIFWFRRDLRTKDNHGLHEALMGDYPVVPLFIFDTEILEKLPEKDARVLFIHQEIEKLKKEFEEKGGSMLIRHGKPLDVYKQLVADFNIKAVFTNRDYEPSARERDKEIYAFLKEKDIPFKGFKDQVIFEKDEVLKDDGDPYVVYTPYSKKWKEKWKSTEVKHYYSERHLDKVYKTQSDALPNLKELGFSWFKFDFPSRQINKEIIRNYHNTRDIPSVHGTSRLSLHLRFGTISIRELAQIASAENQKFFNELIWRDFYQMILYKFPNTLEDSFREKYDRIKWENNETHFKAWCEGKTGYPIVDAGMCELNETGYMHNRVRMIVASFLTKHLLIDWRWGETYFAEKLLDYEAASNVGGWQWAAGSGVDAAPYFRVFNPHLQLEKFDKDLKYVKQYVPEYGTDKYPEPIVDHKAARERALERFKSAVG